MKTLKIFSVLKGTFKKGNSEARLLCKKLGLRGNTNYNLIKFNRKVPIFLITEDKHLDALRKQRVKELKEIPHYRGLRHKYFLPVNGQSTRNNAKTRKKHKIF